MSTTKTTRTLSVSDKLIGWIAPHDGRRKQQAVTLDIEVTEKRLSVSGATWPGPDPSVCNDITSGGQIVDTLDRITTFAPGWSAELVRSVKAVWDRWHLNDVKAGCQHQRAYGWDKRPIDPAKPTNAYGRHFDGQRQDSWNLLGWVRPDEHPDGLLGVPCFECGYRYGTAWMTEELPATVREWTVALVLWMRGEGARPPASTPAWDEPEAPVDG